MELYTRTLGYTGNEQVTIDFTTHDITVPAGFIFDGASTPRIFWSIIPPYKGTKKAAVVHDYLCRHVACDKESRKRADKLFYEMLLEAGLSKLRAQLGYMGVRVGSYFGKGCNYEEIRERARPEDV